MKLASTLQPGSSAMESLLVGIIPVVPFVLLILTRVSVLFAALPAPFGAQTPVTIRVALSFMVSVAVASPYLGDPPLIPLEAIPMLRAGIGEVLVGAVIGLTVRVTLAAAEVAGNIAGLSMGQGFAGTVDPTFGETMLPVGRILGSLAVLIFFALNGHHVMLGALALSLRTAPVGDALSAGLHGGVVDIAAGLLAQGLRIASPVVATMFIVQLGMGLIARSAPRVQIFSLTFAVTSAVGGIVLFAAAPALAAALVESISGLSGALQNALGAR